MSQTIILAKAHVKNDIQIQPTKDEVIQVSAGQPFRVSLAYRVYEYSNDEDMWRFTLSTRLDGEESSSNVVLRDRRFARDDIWSNLGADLMLPEAGEFDLEYDIEASIGRRAWGEAKPHDQVAEKQFSGKVRFVAV